MLATNVDHLVSILPAAENLVVEVRVGKGGAGTITLFFDGGQQRADPPG